MTLAPIPFPKSGPQSSRAMLAAPLSRAVAQATTGVPFWVSGTSSSRRRVASSFAAFSRPAYVSFSFTPKSGLHGSTAFGSSCRRMRRIVSTFFTRSSWTVRLAAPRLTMCRSSTNSGLSALARAACTASVRSRSSVGLSVMVHPGASPNSWEKLRATRMKNASSVPTLIWWRSVRSRANSERHSPGWARRSCASRASSRAFSGSAAPSARRTRTRSMISPAALRVKVDARISEGGAPAASSSMMRLER